MRLVLFTPAIKTSAIGRMASLVTRALTSMGHAVVVVRTENTSLIQTPAHDFGTDLVRWTQSGEIKDLVYSADVVIYQVGNNFAYHQGCLEWLPRAPGIVCLHDFFLGDLFYGWAQDHMEEALATLQAWYGSKVVHNYFGHSSSENFIELTKDAAPMTEWIGSMAYGAITHSSWGIQRVLDSCPGPVQVVPLAYDAPTPMSTAKDTTDPAHQTGGFYVLTIGHINPNKRVESVIRAIADSSILREITTYRLVGKILPDAVERLSVLAKKLQVNLIISDEVDSETLLQAINEADAICCMRWPSLEAASASAIEAMLYGKPVIVTDTGFYAELPNTCVRKIHPQNEIPDLQQALERLYENEGERLALGAEAMKWASATFTAENYANRLIDVSLAAQQAAPMIKAVHFLTGLQQQWGASDGLMILSDTLAPLRLFDSGHETPR